MRYWLVLAQFHIERRDMAAARQALAFALADANRDCRAARPAILRAMNYARAIASRS
jgi:hypothetical protein